MQLKKHDLETVWFKFPFCFLFVSFFRLRVYSVTPSLTFPLTFVTFRALLYSSHAPSFPAPCWAGKWLCVGAGSYEREKKESEKKDAELRSELKACWKFRAHREAVVCRQATTRNLVCDFCSEPKSAKSQEISAVSFSKLLHISSTAATVLENGGSAASVLRSFTLVTCVLLLKFKGDLPFLSRSCAFLCSLRWNVNFNSPSRRTARCSRSRSLTYKCRASFLSCFKV